MLVYVLGIALIYVLGASVTSVLLGLLGEDLKSPAATPIVMFWPIVLPFLVPISLCICLFDKVNSYGLLVYEKNQRKKKEQVKNDNI